MNSGDVFSIGKKKYIVLQSETDETICNISWVKEIFLKKIVRFSYCKINLTEKLNKKLIENIIKKGYNRFSISSFVFLLCNYFHNDEIRFFLFKEHEKIIFVSAIKIDCLK